MRTLRILCATAFVGMGIGVSACQPQAPSDKVAKMDSFAVAPHRTSDAILVGARLEQYIGDVFSSEEKALASKPPELESPSF